MDTKPVEKPVSAAKKKLQADLVIAVQKGDFKKALRLRESIKNSK